MRTDWRQAILYSIKSRHVHWRRAAQQERLHVDFLLQNWLLILVAVGSGAMLLFPALTGGVGQGGMSVADAVQKMNREKAVLVDVREAGEYANERIAQSKNIPLAQLSEKLPQTVKSKSTPVLFLCAHGSRSARAAAIAKKLGYEQAYSVGGGMRSWKSANMPVSGGKA
ncbi:rhodanese-like domain-containing protein [Brachymonas denitrificans]|uniref:rhodanese-like domain-containing protein n=2 Tax=Brachymonas denitrificans TaxID=28220 RepID=UPI00352FA340